MYEQATRAAQGYRAGQEGVWGVWPTATYPGVISADSRILYVDPNHPLAVDDGNTGQDPTSPFATIQAALAWTRDNRGDVVLVGHNDGWQWGEGVDNPIRESVGVTTHGVRIVGVGPSPLGVYWEPAEDGDFALTVLALDVHVEGFAFTNADAGFAVAGGIYSEWNGAGIFGENLSVRRCFFDEGLTTGIQMEFSWNCEIACCIFQACAGYGIYADPAGAGFDYTSIHDNWFHDVLTGAIAMRGCNHNEVLRNHIYNGNAQGGAVATDEGVDATGGRQNLVFDNTFSCLLPVPANGDWDDLNTGSATDAWVNNHCLDGVAVTTPT